MRQMVREHFGDPDEFTGNVALDWRVTGTKRWPSPSTS